LRILLLGSTGQVGTALENTFRNKNIECIGLGREDIEFIHPDEIQNSIEIHKPDVIINSVALQAIDKCELYPAEAFEINATAVLRLAKICQKKDLTLVQLSTHSVFDGKKKDYYTEEDKPNPINVYGASKYVGECFAGNLCEKHYIIRLPTMFGSRRAGYFGFIDKLLKWIEDGRTLRMADNKIDSFGYSRDAAEMIYQMLENKLPYDLYHLTNQGKGSYYDLAITVAKLLDKNIKIHRAKDKEFPALGKKPLKTAMKSNKLKTLRNWKEALEEYIKEEVK
jgi:dTDP-4-dehydrorhamnose reductase